MAEVDLEALARGYRHRPASPASIDRARTTGSSLPSKSWILDIGGGPGHHAAVWAEQGHLPILLDPAVEMTRSARGRGITAVAGVSQALPFRDGCFRLAWFHLSLHYGDWHRAIDEARRVTRSGGTIEIWTLAADHHETSMLARWFPSAAAIDNARFPSGADVERYLAATGSPVSRRHVVEHRTRTAGEWAAAVEAGFVSTLQFIDEAELAAGLAAFHQEHPDSAAFIVYELRFDRVVAER